MRSRLIVLALAAAPLLLAASCNEREEPAARTAPDQGPDLSDIEEAARGAGDAFAAERERLAEQFEEQIELARARAAELRREAEQAGAEARARLNRLADDLAARADAAEARLAELRASGAATWEEIKASARGALDELESAVQRAREPG